jgi:hypothetical protein
MGGILFAQRKKKLIKLLVITAELNEQLEFYHNSSGPQSRTTNCPPNTRKVLQSSCQLQIFLSRKHSHLAKNVNEFSFIHIHGRKWRTRNYGNPHPSRLSDQRGVMFISKLRESPAEMTTRNNRAHSFTAKNHLFIVDALNKQRRVALKELFNTEIDPTIDWHVFDPLLRGQSIKQRLRTCIDIRW